MSEPTAPNSEFVSKLEWQLRSEFRRAHYAEPLRTGRSRTRIVLVAGLALVAGFAAATAGHRYRESARSTLLRARAAVSLELLEARSDLAAEFLAALEEESADDPGKTETLQVSRFELDQIQRETERARLNLEEIQRTGQPPEDSLGAALVDGRDFVTERRTIDQEAVHQRLEMLRSEVEREIGRNPEMADELQRTYLQNELSAAQASLDHIERELQLRRQFLAGEITSRELTYLGEYAAALKRLKTAQIRRKAAELDLENFRDRLKAGRVTRLDVKAFEFHVLQVQADERLAQLELDFLNEQRRTLGGERVPPLTDTFRGTGH